MTRLREIGMLAGVLAIACSPAVRPPAVAGPPADLAKPSDLISEEDAFSYQGSAKAGTPACRALFDDFSKTWEQARPCERDDDCAIVIGKCTAGRADQKATLEHELEALGPCVEILAISRCFDTQAICFEKRCRVRGTPDLAN